MFLDQARKKNPNINFESRKIYESIKHTVTQEGNNTYNKGMIKEADIMSLQDLPFKQEIDKLGGKIYSVGGAVRDEFLGKESKDLDILITGVPFENLEQLLQKYGKVDTVGKSFGVIKFKPKGATEDIDIANRRVNLQWGGAINGLLEGSSSNISTRITQNIDQAFKQSPYLRLTSSP